MDMAELSEGAKKAGSELDKLMDKFGLTQKNLEKVALGITAAFAAAAAGIAYGVKTAIDRADELSKLSQKIGVPIEQISSLAYAADLAGVPLEGLANGIKKLSVNLQDVASGDKTSGAARALAALGVSATDATGKIRPTNDVLLQLSDKFAGLKDDAGKTALAVAIFGKQGSELIPLLNGGAAALAEMTERAQTLGIVIDSQTGKAAEEFNDRLTDVGYLMRGLFTQVSAELLPVINELTKAFADWVRGTDNAKPAAKEIAQMFKTIAESAITAYGAINDFAIRYNNLFTIMVAHVSGDKEALKKINEEIAANAIDTSNALQKLNAIWTKTKNDMQGDNQPKGQKDFPILQSTQSITQAQKDLNKAIADGVALVKQTESPWAKYGRQLNDLNAALQAGKISAAEFNVAQKKIFEDAKINYEGGAELVNKYRTPYEQMIETIRKLNDEYQRGAISALALGRAQEQAALGAATSYADMAGNIAGSLSQVFKKNKGMAIAAGTIDAISAALKALAAYPPPYSYIAAAATFAAGMARVAAIRSTNESGGGSGGGAASSSAAASGPTQAPQKLIVEGIDPNAVFSGVAVKNIANALIQYQKDGGQVIIQ